MKSFSLERRNGMDRLLYFQKRHGNGLSCEETERAEEQKPHQPERRGRERRERERQGEKQGKR